MKLKKGKTKRGFGIVKFKDRYGYECNIQESSIATEYAIWLGKAGENRMHLNMKQVKALLPTLKHFAKTGELKIVKKK